MVISMAICLWSSPWQEKEKSLPCEIHTPYPNLNLSCIQMALIYSYQTNFTIYTGHESNLISSSLNLCESCFSFPTLQSWIHMLNGLMAMSNGHVNSFGS